MDIASFIAFVEIGRTAKVEFRHDSSPLSSSYGNLDLRDRFLVEGWHATARRPVRSRLLDLAAGATGDVAAGRGRRRGGEDRAAGPRRGDARAHPEMGARQRELRAAQSRQEK